MESLPIVLTLAVTILSTVQATNYCALGLCKTGKHIACGNSGDFESTCSEGARMVNLTKIIKPILDSHNTKRNLIASGKLTIYNPARHMATMQWDKEMANVAGFNVKQCVMKHDDCRSTDAFKHSGQNLGIYGYTGDESSYTDTWLAENLIDNWWSEHADCTMEYINKYPNNYKGPAIGHFTVMAVDKNTRVGCAASRWFDGKFNRFLLACNYASTNFIDKPIYTSCVPASGCTKGKNRKYSSLCAPSEVYSGL